MNHVADKLAEDAAARHQLPWGVVNIIKWIDSRANQVQSRLTAVFQPLLEASGEDSQNSARGLEAQPDRPIAANKATLIHDAACHSRHCVAHRRTTLFCGNCNTSVDKQGKLEKVIAWMQTDCFTADYKHQPHLKESVMHHSHVPSSYKGVHFCTACGGWKVVKSVKLQAECPKHPATSGRDFLKRISKGILPGSLKAWPIP